MQELLKPYGDTEVLLYYSLVSKKLLGYLKGKEIAAKNWMGKASFMPSLLKRGSRLEPLFIDEFNGVTDDFLKLRIKHLGEVKSQLTKTQEKLWNYFLPRKLSDFFYATNNEGAGGDIERIFFDIDRSDQSAESAQNVALGLVSLIKKDKEFSRLFPGEIFVMWTGSSFHVYVFLEKLMKNSDYEKYIAAKKDSPLSSFTGRWAAEIAKKLNLRVIAGHEKKKWFINIDPSQTPSGKLCRAPFSLHMKDEKSVDGVAIPLAIKDLGDKNLVKKLKKYTPERVVEELDALVRKLPKG